MSEPAADTGASTAERVEAQRRELPPQWQSFDRMLLRVTEASVFVIGILFTGMITLEVISRYVFNFSIFFVNAAARFLLVWFFLIGAGIALRHGAHVGFELILTLVSHRRRRAMMLTAQALALVFFAEMIWGGWYSLGPAINQTEPGLEMRLVWAFLAIPTGFVLMFYHMVVLMLAEWRRPTSDERQP